MISVLHPEILFITEIWTDILMEKLLRTKKLKRAALRGSSESADISALSRTGMPFARKSLIFGLHSIPADTTPVFLKNCMFSNFSLIKCFFAAPVAEKTKCGVNAATQPDLQVVYSLKPTAFSQSAFIVFNFFFYYKRTLLFLRR